MPSDDDAHLAACPQVTAGADDKLELARSLGAAAAFNYRNGPWAEGVLQATNGHGADIILDCIGAQNWEQNADCIATDGRWVL